MVGQVGTYQARAAVDIAAIPDYRKWTAQLGLELPQKGNDVVAVGVVRQDLEIEIQPALPWTDSDATDDRQPIPSVPAGQDRRLAARRPSSSDGRCQHEA